MGSGEGNIENEIIATYNGLFGEKLHITLVDPNTNQSDFKTVQNLIEKRSYVVRNCILLIIWPYGPKDGNDGYDIEAIRKLQPSSVLTMYELTNASGSIELQWALHSPNRYSYFENRDNDDYHHARLDNYDIEEVAYQEVNYEVLPTLPGWTISKFRIVKLKKID